VHVRAGPARHEIDGDGMGESLEDGLELVFQVAADEAFAPA